ncbi:FKBP-type peptidyl-prolyl cis-trans isomerase, partial [Corynebacterium diphtheriae]
MKLAIELRHRAQRSGIAEQKQDSSPPPSALQAHWELRPLTPVGGVIAGWTEALQLMNAGSKWRLYVPSELAYG